MDWFEYSQMLQDKCKQKEIPYSATFELTPFCNFCCNMCYIRLDSKQAAEQGELLTTEQWKHIADETKKLGVLLLEVTGGEAVTRSDFDSLYNYFIEKGFIITLRTNGYLINDSKIELLRKKKPFRVSITLYGASDETYWKICGIKDGFTTVSRNIIALRDAGIPVRLTATITKDNVVDLERMEMWAKENGFSLGVFGMLFTPIRGAKRSVEHLRIESVDYGFTEELRYISREIHNRDKYMNPFWMCQNFGSKFTITWDGKMSMCNINPMVLKNPFDNNLEMAYRDLLDDLKKVKRSKECETCNLIDYCTACPAMIYSTTGSVERVNNSVCKKAYRVYLDHTTFMNENNEKLQHINNCEGEIYYES